MFNIFEFSQFAGPCSRRKLTRCVGWRTSSIGVNGDLFEVWFQFATVADRIANALVNCDQIGQREKFRYLGRPIVATQRNGLPPIAGVVSCPGEAVVNRSRRTADSIAAD